MNKVLEEFECRPYPIELPEKNIVDTIVPSFLIGSSSNLQISRSGIKSRTCFILGQIRLFALELLALECQHFFS